MFIFSLSEEFSNRNRSHPFFSFQNYFWTKYLFSLLFFFRNFWKILQYKTEISRSTVGEILRVEKHFLNWTISQLSKFSSSGGVVYPFRYCDCVPIVILNYSRLLLRLNIVLFLHFNYSTISLRDDGLLPLPSFTKICENLNYFFVEQSKWFKDEKEVLRI